MAGTQADTVFHFVDWSDVTGPNQDPATRVLIRKQAMSKAAAARKKQGNWGKRNLGQSVVVVLPESQKIRERVRSIDSKSGADHRLPSPPSSISSSESETEYAPMGRESEHEDTTPSLEQRLTCIHTVPPQMASTGYEMLRMQCNFDILDLSALTTFHVGRLTTDGLYKFPTGLIDILRCRQWSYFSYIPSRYGHLSCLDDAARCVISRVRGWLNGETSPKATVLSLYSKALNSLQAAVNDSVLCTKPETLCATEVLSIYEVLGP